MGISDTHTDKSLEGDIVRLASNYRTWWEASFNSNIISILGKS